MRHRLVQQGERARTCIEVFHGKNCPIEATAVFLLCVLASALFGKFKLNYFCKLTTMLINIKCYTGRKVL